MKPHKNTYGIGFHKRISSGNGLSFRLLKMKFL